MRDRPTAPRGCEPANPFRRPVGDVMRLARLGCFHPTRLSFLRILLRRLKRERWRFERRLWQVDPAGVGRAIYTMVGPDRSYSLVAFAHDLPASMRSDRVIATAWDATFALFDGVPDICDLDRLAANVPKQEAGRVSARELTLSRANRSGRLFDHVVERLGKGRQPDADLLSEVGYVMRTTAVYGSGKFGAADRDAICDRPEMQPPFQAEMLTVWLIRAFSLDLVEHLARARGAAAVALAPHLRRRLGVGNATGLGMAPFLVNHPVLLHNWVAAREAALARVRACERAGAAEFEAFRHALAEARDQAVRWRSADPRQRAKLADLRADLERVAQATARGANALSERPWDKLWRWGEGALTLEGQEALLAVLLEPHGALVDDLAEQMSADEHATFRIDGTMPVGALRQLIEGPYAWALGPDYGATESMARFWYVSLEKLEPRLGERWNEPGAERELPLGIGHAVAQLWRTLAEWHDASPLAELLLFHPEHRHVVRRVQQVARHPFGEIRDNLLSSALQPIDLLRCKLSFFGATRFDPRSDRWLRICLFEGAPGPQDLPDAA